jgi:hypothetical protein
MFGSGTMCLRRQVVHLGGFPVRFMHDLPPWNRKLTFHMYMHEADQSLLSALRARSRFSLRPAMRTLHSNRQVLHVPATLPLLTVARNRTAIRSSVPIRRAWTICPADRSLWSRL